MGTDTDRYELLCVALRNARTDAGFTQTDLASALSKPQSYVSKYESGERRLDLVEVENVCRVLKIPLAALIAAYVDAQL